MTRIADLRFGFVMALVALVVGAACSGGPVPTASPSEAPGEIADLSEDYSGETGSKRVKGGGGKGGGKKKAKGAPVASGSGGGTSAGAGGTTVSASGQTVSEKAQTKRSRRLARGLPDVNLWPESTARMGFLKDKIVLCGHAALTFADVFDTRVEDLQVYWKWVNDNGGIFGRDVEMTFEDDGYRPDRAVEAAERCKNKEPFMLLGGIGFDQIPAVRAWNEQAQNRLLYMHHIARADYSKRYSFSFLPTVEQMGVLAARWILSRHRSKDIGVIWRQSEYWEPGHKAFKATMNNARKALVADLPVQKDQHVYTQQISELKARGADTVFIWENALVATEIVKQAKQQDYHPTWLVFPFQLTTDTLKGEALNPPMEGIASWPAYVPGARGGPYSAYDDEIARFEAAQRKYGRARNGNDILWMTWVAMKQLHQLLLDCGPNCDRNRIVALLISGRHKAVPPNCPVDFTKNQHVGGIMGNIFRATNVAGYGPGWVGTTTCARI